MGCTLSSANVTHNHLPNIFHPFQQLLTQLKPFHVNPVIPRPIATNHNHSNRHLQIRYPSWPANKPSSVTVLRAAWLLHVLKRHDTAFWLTACSRCSLASAAKRHLCSRAARFHQTHARKIMVQTSWAAYRARVNPVTRRHISYICLCAHLRMFTDFKIWQEIRCGVRWARVRI